MVDTDSVDNSETFACDKVVIAGATDEVETVIAGAIEEVETVIAGATDEIETVPATDDDNLVVNGIADDVDGIAGVVDTDCSRDLITIGAFVIDSAETFSGKTIVMIGATDDVVTVLVVVVMDTDSVGLGASETLVDDNVVVVVGADVVDTDSVDLGANVVDTDSVDLGAADED